MQGRKVIIFGQTRELVNQLYNMEAFKYQSMILHGEIPQPQREFALEEFKSGSRNIIFTTDVLSRGIDIERVDLIINMSPSLEIDKYVHRSGRTGRAGKTGKCLTFYSPEEKHTLNNIVKMTKIQIKEITILDELFPHEFQPEELLETLSDALELQSDILGQNHIKAAEILIEESKANNQQSIQLLAGLI